MEIKMQLNLKKWWQNLGKYQQWIMLYGLYLLTILVVIAIDSITKELNFKANEIGIIQSENWLIGTNSIWNPNLTFIPGWQNPPKWLVNLANFTLLGFGLGLWWKWRNLVFSGGLALTLGGAMGNTIDRIRFEQGVRDWIFLPWFQDGKAVFNLADGFAMLGTILMVTSCIYQLIQSIIIYRKTN